MSRWTHIVAAIDVDTYIESKTIKSDVEKLLEDAPKITGSESDAHVFVNVLPGHNVSTNYDCDHCKYGNTRRPDTERGGFWCDGPNGYECPEGEYQTRVVITVIGDLRDKTGSKTRKEWMKFKAFIETQDWDIRNCTCKIVDEYEEYKKEKRKREVVI